MPIDYSKYPDNWKQIRQKILNRATPDWTDAPRCEWCDVRNYDIGYREADGTFWRISKNNSYRDAREKQISWSKISTETPIIIVLTVAHIYDHDPHNVDPENLAALCQQCHNQHDAKRRAANRRRFRPNQPSLPELKEN